VNIHNDKATSEEKQSLQQSLQKRWSEELAKKLPPGLDESARKYGAIVRKREIKSALGLLQAMMMYAISDLSQRLLAAYAAVLGIAKVSDQAWQKNYTASCHG
jgi:hypothetical protein